ncbi:hypothetical protein SAMN04488498_1641 [Mesorhizobium albiziae]|uniref:Uncharacterized protein n=1 Tax=Neomesorhizobium albiziae TaxID=335020 RepID=A0A1I4FW63_9HYPH|nr:hypothetical protein SAMN04488498_1641 [Mesorhizobium albiziae]
MLLPSNEHRRQGWRHIAFVFAPGRLSNKMGRESLRLAASWQETVDIWTVDQGKAFQAALGTVASKLQGLHD